jgi:glycosyltransferase involved in cell wall biosynthesis
LLVKKEKIDLIHANNWKATLPLCLLPLKLPCPVIVQHRDVIIKHKRLFEKILQKATYHLAASKYIANSLFSEKEKTKYATSYSTIDMTQFTALPSKKEARNKLNLPQDSDIYINIGNFSLWKKQKRFIEVFAEILKQKPHSFAVIAGKAFDSFANSEREKLIQKINTINLADKIIINNYNYQEIPALFAAADIVLHFADNEPMGRIVLEAYASKRNILVPNSGGSCELVKKLYSAPTRNIFSTERYKPEKVASKAIALLKNKPLFENKNITPFLASTQAKELNTLYSNMLNPTKHQYKMDNLHKRR